MASVRRGFPRPRPLPHLAKRRVFRTSADPPHSAHPGEIGGARHARRIALRAMRRKRRLSPPLSVVHGFAVNNGACRAPTGVAESARTTSRQQPAKSSKSAERHSFDIYSVSPFRKSASISRRGFPRPRPLPHLAKRRVFRTSADPPIRRTSAKSAGRGTRAALRFAQCGESGGFRRRFPLFTASP